MNIIIYTRLSLLIKTVVYFILFFFIIIPVSASNTPIMNVEVKSFTENEDFIYNWLNCDTDSTKCDVWRPLSISSEKSWDKEMFLNKVTKYHSKETRSFTTEKCITYWDYPGQNGIEGCNPVGPYKTNGTPPLTYGLRKGHAETKGFPHYKTDENDNTVAQYTMDYNITEDAEMYLILDPASWYNSSENNDTENALWSAEFAVSVTKLTPNSSYDPVGGPWDYAELPCKSITDPAGTVSRKGWTGNDCRFIAIAKGKSATNVTPEAKADFYHYDLGWTGLKEVSSSLSPTLSKASATASVVSLSWFSKMLAQVISVFDSTPLPSSATTTVTLSGNNFSTSDIINILLTPIDSTNNDNISLDVRTDNSNQISFEIPTNLISEYQIQVRNSDSDWSRNSSLGSLLGLSTIDKPIISTSTPANLILLQASTTPSSVIFSWSSSLINLKYTLIENMPENKILISNSSSTYFQISPIQANTKYCAYVIASSTSAMATSSTVCINTLRKPISIPTLSITDITNWSMTYVWDDSDTDIAKYTLIQTNGSNDYGVFTPAFSVLKTGNGSYKKYIKNNLVYDHRYCAVVVAENTSGSTATSTESCATIKNVSMGGGGYEAPPVVPPSIPTVVDPGSGGEVPTGGRDVSAP